MARKKRKACVKNASNSPIPYSVKCVKLLIVRHVPNLHTPPQHNVDTHVFHWQIINLNPHVECTPEINWYVTFLLFGIYIYPSCISIQEVFCTKEQQLICTLCYLVGSHKGHSVISI